MLRASRRWLLGLAGFCLVGCLSPTLPLPPPAEPGVTGPDADGNVRLQGSTEPNARVLAFNERTEKLAGQLTDAKGRYDFLMAAKAGDRVVFWYEKNDEQSEAVYFEIE